MSKIVFLEASHACSEAVKAADVDVICAYPITPQTHIVEKLAEFCANGELDAEFINCESEHSALSICAGASAVGARVFTCTSGQGLALMHELLFVCSGMRLPIVMAVANRALSAPLNIWGDHSDSLVNRDSCWIQIYCENSQEVYDSIILAYKIAEDPRISLPVMVNMDGFHLSHLSERMMVEEKDSVLDFLGKFRPRYRLHPDSPISMGCYASPDFYMEFKRQQQSGMESALELIPKIHSDFKSRFGREYGFIEKYRLEDARIGLVTMGSFTGNAREAVDEARSRGIKAGLLKLRIYRPLNISEIREALKDVELVGTVDRHFSYGFGPVIWSELRCFLGNQVAGFVAGLGGRDVSAQDFLNIIERCQRILESGAEPWYEWYGLRE